MTFRIQEMSGRSKITVFRLSGHIQSEHLNKIEKLILREIGHVALDLNEVTLVDRDAVSYLARCKRKGIQLRNSPLFLTEWISKEQAG
jgi:hypothetical protein